jgi:hypothetical protein
VFNDVQVTKSGVTFRYYAQPSTPLKENERWERDERGEWLVSTDPETGVRSIVLWRDVPEMMTLFSASIDPRSGKVEILEDRDISAIKENEIEHPRLKPAAGGDEQLR